MTRLVAMILLLACAGAARAAGPPDAEAWRRFGKIAEASRLEQRGISLYRAGKVAEASKVFASVLTMRERLYPEGHPQLLSTLNNLAALHQASGDGAEAERLLRRAVAMLEAPYSKRRYPQGHPHALQTLINLGSLYHSLGDYAKAEPLMAFALKVREAQYPKTVYPHGHSDLAASLSNLAVLRFVQGDYAKAEPLLARVLAMNEGLHPKTRYPDGHPDLAKSLSDLAAVHRARGDDAKAEPLLLRALTMRERLYPRSRFPQGHTEVASGLLSLAGLYESRGEYEKAEPLFLQALAMRERLYPRAQYPRGHPALADCLNNLAGLYREQGEYAKAEPLYRRALTMRESPHPKGDSPPASPALGRSLNNLALLYYDQGKYAAALPLFRRALEIREALYPVERFPSGHPELVRGLNHLACAYQRLKEFGKAEPLAVRALESCEARYPLSRFPLGHRDLALSLNHLAALRYARGESAKAEVLWRRTLEMSRGLYPKGRYPHGHPDLVHGSSNLAFCYLSQGQYAKAGPLFREALAGYGDYAAGLAASTSEASALNYLASKPPTRDGYLSATLHLPETDAYPAVWQSKAALARVAERRHLAVVAVSSKAARELWDAIRDVRRERERLLLAAVAPASAKVRDARLDELDEQIRTKEAALRSLLPALGRSDDLAEAAPADLRKALPDDAAFIDLLRYTLFEQDPKVPGEAGEKRTPHYVAFVVTRTATTRVEIGPAKSIEEALDLWRQAIAEDSDSHAKYANILRELVWAPVAKHLGAAKTVYLCPDMDLSRLPWAALPGQAPGTILLEDHLLVTVPHGPYLLDQLTAKRKKTLARPTVLAMGGVSYDDKPATTLLASLRSPMGGQKLWGELKGTGAEVSSLKAMPGDRTVLTLTGDKAGVAALLAELPRADIAHLATHGYFADAKFRSVLQLDEKLFARIGGERSSAGARSPMVLSGLVCAGANLADTPNRGIVTADAIVGLDLRRLNLAVLSACETGLGDVAGGEGVFGLQRAFHVAGARNVVASLWKVDDEATAALMKLFYNNLWVERLGPAEAMRQAQLAVYRRPGSVKGWAARAPLPRPVAGGATTPREKGAKVASPKVYAAFVLSGPGD